MLTTVERNRVPPSVVVEMKTLNACGVDTLYGRKAFLNIEVVIAVLLQPILYTIFVYSLNWTLVTFQSVHPHC